MTSSEMSAASAGSIECTFVRSKPKCIWLDLTHNSHSELKRVATLFRFLIGLGTMRQRLHCGCRAFPRGRQYLRGDFNAKSDICWNDCTRSHYRTFPGLCAGSFCRVCITACNHSRLECSDGCADCHSQEHVAAHS